MHFECISIREHNKITEIRLPKALQDDFHIQKYFSYRQCVLSVFSCYFCNEWVNDLRVWASIFNVR